MKLSDLREKAVSKQQQKFMGMVRAKQKGEMDDASPEVAKAAKSMSKKDVKDFASTKHKGLPDKKEGVEENRYSPLQMAKAKKEREDRKKKDGESDSRYQRIMKKQYGSLKKEDTELEEWQKETPWKKSPQQRKDKYGNVIKTKNIAKNLAKSAQKQTAKEDVDLDEATYMVTIEPGTYGGVKSDGKPIMVNAKSTRDATTKAAKKVKIDPRLVPAGGFKVKVNEEVEQIDEISAKLARKAAAASDARAYDYSSSAYDDETQKYADHLSNKADKALAHVKKRQGDKGIRKTNRLSNKLIYGKSRYSESVEVDEAKGTGVKKFVKGMRVANLHNPNKKGTVIKGGDNMKKAVEVEWDSGTTTLASGKYLTSIKKNESVDLGEAYKTPAEAGAIAAGKKAARQGKKYSDNPHKKGTPEFTAWSKGHNMARESVELGEAKISVGDRVTLQPNKNTLDQSLIGKAGVVTGMVGSKPTVKFANGKTIAVSPKDLTINESVELDEASYPLASKWQSGAKVVKKGKVELTRGSGGVHSIKVNGKSVGDFSLDDDSGMWVTNVKGKKGQGTYDEIDDIVNAMMKESVQHTFFTLREARRDAAKDLYFDTYSAAVQTALADVKKKGFEVDEDDWHDSITTGSGKPGRGKTVRHTISLTKGGKPQRKALHIQVYNRDTDKKTYELNYYVS